MSEVKLKIIEPAQAESSRVGSAQANAVQLRGQVLSSGHRPLFFKWYSNLKGDTEGVVGTTQNVTAALKVGSHVVMFTAKDIQGDTPANLQAVQDSGMTGGAPPDAPAPCLIHVYLARMLTPLPTGATPTLSKANSTLEAEAPSQWGKSNVTPPAPPYVLNLDYHRTNRVRYRWVFRSGTTQVGELIPQQLTFDIKGDGTPFVRYQGALPGALVVGTTYTLALRVEDKNNPTVGDEVSRPVTIGN